MPFWYSYSWCFNSLQTLNWWHRGMLCGSYLSINELYRRMCFIFCIFSSKIHLWGWNTKVTLVQFISQPRHIGLLGRIIWTQSWFVPYSSTIVNDLFPEQRSRAKASKFLKSGEKWYLGSISSIFIWLCWKGIHLI